ncbi:hypothetical protein JW960_22370 [candidate division KSB1 bacterium]|nr:hypothetical protein [candidate division KSB1 bacterium]
MKLRTIRYIFWFMGILIGMAGIVRCVKDAPRDNPLDPVVNPNKCWVQGTVYRYYPPFRPVSSARIQISPGNQWVDASPDGVFAFTDLQPGDYLLYASASGYSADTIHVSLEQSSGKTVQFNLNALPKIESFIVRSEHINMWRNPQSLYRLYVETTVSDPDGIWDVKNIRFLIPQFTFVDTINTSEYYDSPGKYIVHYSENKLPGSSIENLLGYPMFIEAIDDINTSVLSSPVYLARIINMRPNTVEPQGFIYINDPRPVLKWQPVDELVYPFTYRIEVFWTISGVNKSYLKWSQNVMFETDSIRVSQPLDRDENYYWTVSVVDEFGNWSSSREAEFKVTQ